MIGPTLGAHSRNVWEARQGLTAPLEFWLGRGYPLNPYLKGHLIFLLRTLLKPRELKVIPEDLMSEDDLQFLERTMLRHWVLQWLKLVSWYYTVLASDYVTIEEALSGPVVATDWRAQKDVNSALLKYGLLWKIDDRIAPLGLLY